MTHPLVTQLRFTRSKFIEGFAGVSAEDAVKLVGEANCLSWIVGHLAVHETRVWCEIAQGELVAPEVLVCEGGQPKCTPPFDEMLHGWQQITAKADDFLDTITQADMHRRFMGNGKPEREDIGTMLQRNIYHYWYHLGEAQGIRQVLGHTDLIQYVGKIPPDATYTPEDSTPRS